MGPEIVAIIAVFVAGVSVGMALMLYIAPP